MKKSINEKEQSCLTDVKCRFFAQYWGQKVMKKNIEGLENFYSEPDGFIRSMTIDSPLFLELKPLSKITDDDALYAADLLRNGSHLSNESRIFQFKKLFESPNFWVNQTNIPLNNMLKVFDYLRSKGYALPFMGYSVDNLISFGWVRLF
jgi:capsule polysaccharide export protein KpsC/LpsZ